MTFVIIVQHKYNRNCENDNDDNNKNDEYSKYNIVKCTRRGGRICGLGGYNNNCNVIMVMSIK